MSIGLLKAHSSIRQLNRPPHSVPVFIYHARARFRRKAGSRALERCEDAKQILSNHPLRGDVAAAGCHFHGGVHRQSNNVNCRRTVGRADAGKSRPESRRSDPSMQVPTDPGEQFLAVAVDQFGIPGLRNCKNFYLTAVGANNILRDVNRLWSDGGQAGALRETRAEPFL